MKELKVMKRDLELLFLQQAFLKVLLLRVLFWTIFSWRSSTALALEWSTTSMLLSGVRCVTSVFSKLCRSSSLSGAAGRAPLGIVSEIDADGT